MGVSLKFLSQSMSSAEGEGCVDTGSIGVPPRLFNQLRSPSFAGSADMFSAGAGVVPPRVFNQFRSSSDDEDGTGSGSEVSG